MLGTNRTENSLFAGAVKPAVNLFDDGDACGDRYRPGPDGQTEA